MAPPDYSNAFNNRIWPDVDTLSSAAWATKQAFGVAVFIAVGTSLLALLGEMGVGPIRSLGYGAWSFAGGLVYGFIALGLSRHSRVAAWAGLILYTADRAYMWRTFGTTGGLLGLMANIMFVLAFIGGIRGTSALCAAPTEGVRSLSDEPVGPFTLFAQSHALGQNVLEVWRLDVLSVRPGPLTLLP